MYFLGNDILYPINIYTMDYSDLAVSNVMKSSIGLKMVNT